MCSSSSSDEDCVITDNHVKSLPIVAISSDEEVQNNCVITDSHVKSPPIIVISSDEGEVENSSNINVTPESVIQCVATSPPSSDDPPQTPHKCSSSPLPSSECMLISSSSGMESDTSQNHQKPDSETSA